MAADGADVVRAAAAKGGDMAAARMILDRLVPVRKGRAIALDLPEVVTVADVLQAQAAVVAAMAGGEVSPDEAAVVSGVLEGQRKALETVEFEERLRALEERVGTKP